MLSIQPVIAGSKEMRGVSGVGWNRAALRMCFGNDFFFFFYLNQNSKISIFYQPANMASLGCTGPMGALFSDIIVSYLRDCFHGCTVNSYS